MPRKPSPFAAAVLAAFAREPVGAKAKRLAAVAGCSPSHVVHVLATARIQSAFLTPAERSLLGAHRRRLVEAATVGRAAPSHG